jgi:serine/threonine-protein kinase PRP4
LFAFYTEYHLGEVLDGHYRITAGYGKGVFSTVVQAKDLTAGENDPEVVAIKIICNDDTKER